jgi:hypothetical protein
VAAASVSAAAMHGSAYMVEPLRLFVTEVIAAVAAPLVTFVASIIEGAAVPISIIDRPVGIVVIAIVGEIIRPGTIAIAIAVRASSAATQ